MDIIRLATEPEITPIAADYDITPLTTCITFGGKDFAIVRNCNELDMRFGDDTGDKRKLLFLMNMETAMRLQGMKEMYFNLPASDQNYQAVMKHWGAEPISTEPMIRFKKVL
jgi:hypothetical protein